VVARFVLWSLADSQTSIDELRAQSLPRTPGATCETWFSDEATERFGAFALFPDADAASAPVPEQLRELIAKDPDVVELFDLESQ
jgi:hypothetical protein